MEYLFERGNLGLKNKYIFLFMAYVTVKISCLYARNRLILSNLLKLIKKVRQFKLKKLNFLKQTAKRILIIK